MKTTENLFLVLYENMKHAVLLRRKKYITFEAE
jgi:hypothetical protein